MSSPQTQQLLKVIKLKIHEPCQGPPLIVSDSDFQHIQFKMAEEIKAIRFDVEEIGKHVKGSKKRFTWIFSLHHKNHTIIVDFSFISGKVKVIVDRKTLLENELPTNVSFQHPFTLDGYALNILQQGQTFQLRINNKVFSHLYNQVKTNSEFKNYEEEVKDIKVDEAHLQGQVGKKIKLNIGGVDMKKKNYKSTASSQNWDNFGGSSMDFPNYFGDNATQSSGSSQPPQKSQPKQDFNLIDDQEEQKVEKIEQKAEQFFDFNQQTQKTSSPKKNQPDDFFSENTQTATSPNHQQLNTMMKKNSQEEDFNTMQNLFATMNVQGTAAQTQQTSSLNFFDQQSKNTPQTQQPLPQVPPSNDIFNVNMNDFNTMQNLFATTNPGQNIPPNQNQSQQANNYGNFSEQRPQHQNFNTMNYNMGGPQFDNNAFSTSVPQKKQSNPFDLLDGHIEKFKQHASSNQDNKNIQHTKASDSNIQNVNMSDFNTMQNLFKTQNPTMPQQPTQNLAMEDMFKASEKQTNEPSQQTSQDFNTMQNLFSTQANVQQIQTPKAPEQPSFAKKSQPFEEDLL